eukprot:scaffold84571_cov59-Phaeocystis_antarctica.AAC.4
MASFVMTRSRSQERESLRGNWLARMAPAHPSCVALAGGANTRSLVSCGSFRPCCKARCCCGTAGLVWQS